MLDLTCSVVKLEYEHHCTGSISFNVFSQCAKDGHDGNAHHLDSLAPVLTPFQGPKSTRLAVVVRGADNQVR
jgi:hypothetical protein